jgi:hypothetical protein
MDARETSTRACARCGRDHTPEIHRDADAARVELARACRDARADDVLVLAAQADLLDARARLAPRGFASRACIELDVERRRRAS